MAISLTPEPSATLGRRTLRPWRRASGSTAEERHERRLERRHRREIERRLAARSIEESMASRPY